MLSLMIWLVVYYKDSNNLEMSIEYFIFKDIPEERNIKQPPLNEVSWCFGVAGKQWPKWVPLTDILKNESTWSETPNVANVMEY